MLATRHLRRLIVTPVTGAWLALALLALSAASLRADISQWSTTPGSNATITDLTCGSINFAENQAPGTVNDSARALMAAMTGASRMKAVSCLELPVLDDGMVDIERPLAYAFPNKPTDAMLLADIEQLIANMASGDAEEWSHRPAWFGWSRHDDRMLFWVFAESLDGEGPDLGIVYSDSPPTAIETRGRILADTVRTERGAVLEQVAALLSPAQAPRAASEAIAGWRQ